MSIREDYHLHMNGLLYSCGIGAADQYGLLSETCRDNIDPKTFNIIKNEDVEPVIVEDGRRLVRFDPSGELKEGANVFFHPLSESITRSASPVHDHLIKFMYSFTIAATIVENINLLTSVLVDDNAKGATAKEFVAKSPVAKPAKNFDKTMDKFLIHLARDLDKSILNHENIVTIYPKRNAEDNDGKSWNRVAIVTYPFLENIDEVNLTIDEFKFSTKAAFNLAIYILKTVIPGFDGAHYTPHKYGSSSNAPIFTSITKAFLSQVQTLEKGRRGFSAYIKGNEDIEHPVLHSTLRDSAILDNLDAFHDKIKTAYTPVDSNLGRVDGSGKIAETINEDNEKIVKENVKSNKNGIRIDIPEPTRANQPQYPGQPVYPDQPQQPVYPGQQPVYPGQSGHPHYPGQPVYSGQPQQPAYNPPHYGHQYGGHAAPQGGYPNQMSGVNHTGNGLRLPV